MWVQGGTVETRLPDLSARELVGWSGGAMVVLCVQSGPRMETQPSAAEIRTNAPSYLNLLPFPMSLKSTAQGVASRASPRSQCTAPSLTLPLMQLRNAPPGRSNNVKTTPAPSPARKTGATTPALLRTWAPFMNVIALFRSFSTTLLRGHAGQRPLARDPDTRCFIRSSGGRFAVWRCRPSWPGESPQIAPVDRSGRLAHLLPMPR
jgi:hypothetical protein